MRRKETVCCRSWAQNRTSCKILVHEMDSDFDTLIRKFDEYFLAKRNIIHERTKFHERHQKEGETVERFYRTLRSLINHCQYRGVEEQLS